MTLPTASVWAFVAIDPSGVTMSKVNVTSAGDGLGTADGTPPVGGATEGPSGSRPPMSPIPAIATTTAAARPTRRRAGAPCRAPDPHVARHRGHRRTKGCRRRCRREVREHVADALFEAEVFRNRIRHRGASPGRRPAASYAARRARSP